MRRLVVCCDGTWNRPRTRTNVYRTFTFLREQVVRDRRNEPVPRNSGSEIVRGHTAAGTELVLFYDQGVGTSLGEQLLGGAFGAGLSKNVCDAYRFLASYYTPDSEIYLFGFSRGAYTVRSLCGFIAAARGLLRGAFEDEIALAYLTRYARADNTVADLLDLGVSNRDRLLEALSHFVDGLTGQRRPGRRSIDDIEPTPVKLRLVGVYDTVGALGIPLPKLSEITAPVVHFHNQTLGPTVEHAVHAMAVDEHRGPYKPTIWALPAGLNTLAAEQSCLQVWFPGVHSDVGGGYDDQPLYPDRGIGEITWHFMMQQAARRGLSEARAAPAATVGDTPRQHDSFDSFWRLESSRFEAPSGRLRAIGDSARVSCGEDPCVAAGQEMLHPSLVRFGRQVDILTGEGNSATKRRDIYDPANLKGVELPVFDGDG